jgi:thymidylate synthase (FAD)
MAAPSLLHTAKLDWITPEAERVVAAHARVSTKDPDRSESIRLLRYCIKHGHWSVFEQVCASYEIITTRAISPQILRHRSFTFQETSQRYCDPLDVLEKASPEAPEFELRAQDNKNRQNSFAFEDDKIEREFRERIRDLFEQSQDLYQDLLHAGVAKECARNALLMCVPTKLHMMGTLRSWIFYVGLRNAPGTQHEHRTIARAIGNDLFSQTPVIAEALVEAAYQDNNSALIGWQHI